MERQSPPGFSEPGQFQTAKAQSAVTDGGPPTPDKPGSPSRRLAWLAIAAIFAVNGVTFGSWISRIPSITDRLDLSPGQVGIALMAIAAGALVAFPLTGRLVDTRSSATTVLLFAVIMVVALPFISIAPHLLLLILALLVFGFGNGGMDVSMNAQGIEVERFAGRSIINSLHGCFSLGAFVGAALGAGAALLNLPPLVHFLVISALGLIVLGWVHRWLIPDTKDPRQGAPAAAFSLPPRSLWLLGTLALCASVGEGAVADWSGLYLREVLHTSSGFAALGFAAFSVAMLVGRFTGDMLVRRFGAPHLVRYGGALAALGLGIALVLNQPVVMLLGFAAVGLGLSIVYPLVFSAAGNHPTLPRGQAVASVATVGYGGFLAGPPILGWLAEFTSLRAILALIVVLAAMTALLANATRSAVTHRE
ncbi:MAG: MFS transporter [Chloroflexi bacterium]|nr:MFS transporter [Chloroflexota bacterium]